VAPLRTLLRRVSAVCRRIIASNFQGGGLRVSPLLYSTHRSRQPRLVNIIAIRNVDVAVVVIVVGGENDGKRRRKSDGKKRRHYVLLSLPSRKRQFASSPLRENHLGVVRARPLLFPVSEVPSTRDLQVSSRSTASRRTLCPSSVLPRLWKFFPRPPARVSSGMPLSGIDRTLGEFEGYNCDGYSLLARQGRRRARRCCKVRTVLPSRHVCKLKPRDVKDVRKDGAINWRARLNNSVSFPRRVV